MPAYRKPLTLPDDVPGYDCRTMRIACLMLAAQGPAVFATLEAVAGDETIRLEDRTLFAEIAAAAQHVLVINQLPPPGWRLHRAPFHDEDGTRE